MKLPFSFGNRLFFRLLLPGFLIAILASPFFNFPTASENQIVSQTAYYTLGTIGAGLWVMLFDQQIYMFLQGRKFWPQSIMAIGYWYQERKLKRWAHLANRDHPQQIEYQILAQRYPIGRSKYPPVGGEPYVEKANRTRQCNLWI